MRRYGQTGNTRAGKVTPAIVREIRSEWHIRPRGQSFPAFAIDELLRLRLRWHVVLSSEALRDIVAGKTWPGVR